MRTIRHIRVLLGAALLVAGIVTGCQDTSPNPATWTVGELHVDVGLAGGHQSLDCAGCHGEGSLNPALAACEDCHLESYEQVTDPNHVERGFPTQCAECHTSMAWRPARFDHEAFGFVLLGAHADLVCAACHPAGQAYSGLPTDCFGCHEADFDDAADPDHEALQLSHECTDCHDTRDWSPATFNHDLTTFALRGAHVEVTCVTCHAEGFSGTATDCIACHAEDEPRDHFGPDCSACHTDAAWEPSTFDHEPSFPLQRGNHRDYRNDCAACHTDLADYEVFTCTNCHDGEHERRETDDDHDDVSDYRYDSIACYDCHPRGDEDDAEDGDDD